MNITINQIPPKVAEAVKSLSRSKSAYCRAALAEALKRDGKKEAARLLISPAKKIK